MSSGKKQTLYSVDQIRAIEQASNVRLSDGRSLLMERAGACILKNLLTQFPLATHYHIVCGTGNNGGDGFVLARLAQAHGLSVTVYIHKPPQADDARLAFKAMQCCGIEALDISRFVPDSGIVVDCILGIGLASAPRAPWQSLIESINCAELPVVAIDVPSGVCADTGFVFGQAVKAELCLTFIGAKQGLYTGDAPEYRGTVIVDSLGVDLPVANTGVDLITRDSLAGYLPERSPVAHKGHCGHVLVIGGDAGYGGAALMAATAALRTGAGLVSVLTHREHASVFLGSRPELMVNGIDTPRQHAEQIEVLLEKADVIVLGPGLGQREFGRHLYEQAVNHLLKAETKAVLDADALNLLAQTPQRLNAAVLTPHPGEAGRLLACPTSQVNSKRFASARSIAQRYGGMTLLKGAGSIVDNGINTSVCPDGNPGMASGGMGDVLSGIIGGLMAQGLSCEDALVAGTWVHAHCADRAVVTQGEPGLLASNLIDHLADALGALQ